MSWQCQLCGVDMGARDAQCPGCGEYGTVTSDTPPVDACAPPPASPVEAPAGRSVPLLGLATELRHHPTGMALIDTALGGGLVLGYTILVAGAPGSGKTTLLLALAEALHASVLFASGEENAAQVGHAAARLGMTSEGIRFMESDSLAEILEEAALVQPRLLVINSINTTRSQRGRIGAWAAASVMREAVAWTDGRPLMTMFAGHLTWRGHSAGPRDLEHDVGAVLYLTLEGARRVLEVRKSRVGPSPQRLEVPDLSHLVASPDTTFLLHPGGERPTG